MRGIVVFDADNTIWDTNAVFQAAQIALLQTLSNAGLLTNPTDQVAALRLIDRRLMSLHGRAEYNFDSLATALVIYFSQHVSPDEAAQAAIGTGGARVHEEYGSLIQVAHTAFDDALHSAPPLFADALPVLNLIRASSSLTSPLALILLTEGDVNRIERILSAHRFRERALFDEILLLEKSMATMAQTRAIGCRVLNYQGDPEHITAVLIGDSMTRDIKPANQAGFVTVYKPADFKGFETPQTDDEVPDYVIRSLAELPGVLRNVNLEICSTVP